VAGVFMDGIGDGDGIDEGGVSSLMAKAKQLGCFFVPFSVLFFWFRFPPFPPVREWADYWVRSECGMTWHGIALHCIASWVVWGLYYISPLLLFQLHVKMIPTSIDSCFEWILLAYGDGIQWFIDRLVGCHLLFVPILLLLLYDFHAV
jgi:hypothetical protein